MHSPNRGSILLIVFLVAAAILALGVLLVIGVIFGFSSGLLKLPAGVITPNQPVVFQNTSELTYLSPEDKQTIFDAIDAAKHVEGFDATIFNTYSDVLKKYNDPTGTDKPYLISPEFMADNPTGVIVDYGDRKVDFLDNVNFSALTDKDLPELKYFTKTFFEEFTQYPLAWMDKATPPVIVFVRALKSSRSDEVLAGLEKGIIVYNVVDPGDDEYVRQTIHHELMHWIERSTQTEQDPNWPSTYEDYQNNYNLGSPDNDLEHPKQGFVTGYSLTDSFEDKAETYSYLFTPEGQTKLNTWTRNDPVLKTKVDYLKNLMKSRVAKMDDKYFEMGVTEQ